VTLLARQGMQANAVELGDISFHTRPSFNFHALLITLIVAAFYLAWW
jgi:solute:Na+ symporter, SSS family